MSARPLRAIVLVVALWSGGRGTYLWLETDRTTHVGPDSERLPPVAGSAMATPISHARAQGRTRPFPARATSPLHIERASRSRQELWTSVAVSDAAPPTTPSFSASAAGSALPQDTALATHTQPVLQIPPRTAPTDTATWSGSFWFAAREGAGAALAAGQGQLGGSQAGFRVYRNLTPAVALTGRVSTALATRGGEASAGIALRRGALALLAERRFALDGAGRNDWSLTAVAGVSDVALPFDVRMDGYAQAGVVGRDGFADGALRVERTVAGDGANRLSVGAGIWGSVQPGLARLDIGPQIVARTALGGRAVRLSAEWRQRIAGHAAPGSGPAITLGTDF